MSSLSYLKPCPLPGCETRIAWWLTVCGFHWSRLPLSLRRQIAAANRGRQHGDPLTPRQFVLIERAVTAASKTLELKGAA